MFGSNQNTSGTGFGFGGGNNPNQNTGAFGSGTGSFGASNAPSGTLQTAPLSDPPAFGTPSAFGQRPANSGMDPPSLVHGLSSYLTLTSCRSFWIRNNLCVWTASDTAYHDLGLWFLDWLWKHFDHHERFRSKYRNQWRLIWRETYNIGVWRWIFWRWDWRIRKHWRLWN
jgi:hypothetical protein